tara:strand:- start:951 stop:1163 length:213 start_codon:yes stop_codon:yes gene_type:complete
MSNQIKLTIDVSDELLDKLLTVMAISQASSPALGGMPMQLMALAQGAQGKQGKPPSKQEKAPIGFGRGEK